MKEHLGDIAIEFLQQLISVPSFSKEENKTASLIQDFLNHFEIKSERKGNNIWAKNMFYDASLPTLLLNSHHDTVKPNPAYTRDPFSGDIADGKLYGLGSNDAGGSLVSLMSTFMYYHQRPNLKYNLVLATTAEEEISGTGGIELIWNDLPPISCAIVGEPTLTQVAIAEKGLLVIDCQSQGKAGHAAREEGVNAIYKAIDDIQWFRDYRFPKVSPTLGEVKMSVTVIHGGQAHNQVPPKCDYTVDIRVTDAYSLEDVLAVVQQNVASKLNPRSLRLRPSSIPVNHPIVLAAKKIGKTLYGSPTTSDQALMPVPSVKMGPGDSSRSHSADEFIYIAEIEQGIHSYIGLLDEIL